MSSSTTQNQIIEHVVLFKLNDDGTNSGKINTMINGLNELVTLNQVLHLFSGPIHQLRRSTSTTVSAFTHVLHSRYRSKEDLDAYAIHPDHVSIVKEAESIREDVMAVDWIPDQVPGTLAPPPGSIAKITLLKLKENIGEEAKLKIMEVIKEKFRGIDQISVGENFSPARAKGFSFGSILYFRDLGDVEAVDDQMKLRNEKIRDYLDDTIDVEFVVVSSSSQPSDHNL